MKSGVFGGPDLPYSATLRTGYITVTFFAKNRETRFNRSRIRFVLV